MQAWQARVADSICSSARLPASPLPLNLPPLTPTPPLHMPQEAAQEMGQAAQHMGQAIKEDAIAAKERMSAAATSAVDATKVRWCLMLRALVLEWIYQPYMAGHDV